MYCDNALLHTSVNASCIEGTVILRLGEDEALSTQYLIDGELSVGRVEACIGGRFGAICSEVWDNQDASVICRQLGFSPYGKFFISHIYYIWSILWTITLLIKENYYCLHNKTIINLLFNLYVKVLVQSVWCHRDGCIWLLYKIVGVSVYSCENNISGWQWVYTASLARLT